MWRSAYEENKKERKEMDKKIQQKREKREMRINNDKEKWKNVANEWNKWRKKNPKMIFLNHKRKLIKMAAVTEKEIEAEQEFWQI